VARTDPIYRIRGWWDKSHYLEIGKSSEVVSKHYQTFKIRQDGGGYIELLDDCEGGERRYANWIAACMIAGSQAKEVRNGWLTEDGTATGRPLTARRMSRKARTTVEGMQDMLDHATKPEIDWIVKYDSAQDIPEELLKGCEVPAEDEPDEPEPLSKDALDLCEKLVKGMKRNDPKCKVPTAFRSDKGWGMAARLLLTRDGRDHKEAVDVLRFAVTSDFWRSNILSIKKFRKQYPTLLLQMKRGPINGKASKQATGQNAEAADEYKNAK